MVFFFNNLFNNFTIIMEKMKKSLCNFDLSKLSFEKGYIIPVGKFRSDYYYNNNGILNGDVTEQLKESFKIKKEKNITIQEAEKLNPLKSYHVPMFSDLQDWLREKHDIHVNIQLYSWMDKTYEYVIHFKDGHIFSSKFLDEKITGDYYVIFEKGLKHGLNLIKN